ncbi:hypothetical protein MNB_SUP05-SYMBIONT-5-803 [hydrothermal vent metagenome]|uniref:GspL cytoplasmic actin-ATPase-like domain-containing protein n=1 Tax=hydrothermal vent metagenome TaxID=652676 RepID=A0A1W1E646_9ZZZZ
MNIIYYSKTGEFSKPISKSCNQTIIAIDSQLISTHQITLPKMNAAKARKAIPFALEPELLDEIDMLAFFPKKSSQPNQWDVLVIAQEILDTLARKLQQAQCHVTAIVPDFMLLPVKENATYITQENLITYRYGNLQGGCLTQDLFHPLFDNTTKLTPEDTSYHPANTISLLSNPHDLIKYMRPWRIPAVVALITLALSTTQVVMNNERLAKQLKTHKTHNEQQFRTLFPDIKRIVNMRVQTKQRLAFAIKQKSAYTHDFLTQLSKHARTNTQASKAIFKQKKLTISPLK